MLGSDWTPTIYLRKKEKEPLSRSPVSQRVNKVPNPCVSMCDWLRLNGGCATFSAFGWIFQTGESWAGSCAGRRKFKSSAQAAGNESRTLKEVRSLFWFSSRYRDRAQGREVTSTVTTFLLSLSRMPKELYCYFIQLGNSSSSTCNFYTVLPFFTLLSADPGTKRLTNC